MRWKPVALSVVERLRLLGHVGDGESHDLKEIVAHGRAVESFCRLHRLMCNRGWTVGWNKVLSGNVIHGWYGNSITTEPLRIVAFEIEADERVLKYCFQILNALYNGSNLNLTTKALTDANRLLQECGADLLQNRIEPLDLSLLRRINLDQREKPFAERIYWSGKTGQIILSDGGRHQVTRELVWTRAIESGLESNGLINRQVGEILSNVASDSQETILPEGELEIAAKRFLSCLKTFKFARLEGDRLVLSVSPGEFPTKALEIWGESED